MRATWLQTVRAESLSSLGLTQHRESVTLPAGRGTIFDRGGFELALGERATTVYANPMQIANPRRAAVAVEHTLGLSADRIFPILADRSHGFVYVARQADPAQAAALKRLKLPGFGFYPEERRTYPQGSVAAQVLGFVGTDGNGLSGLELQFEKSLAGRDGKETIVKDPGGRVIDVQGERPEVPGSRPVPDARPQHPGERGGGAARHRSEVGRQERERHRARPAHRRDHGDGRAAGLRREPLPVGADRLAAEQRRSRIPMSPARRSS